MNGMQPSEVEIAREMENIRSMKRLSSQTGPGSLTLDPDLPSPTSSLSGQRRSPISPGARGSLDAADTGSDDPEVSIDDPSHLFWVPAHLHPELAPGEFRQFLKEHTRSVEEASEETITSQGIYRSNSGSSSNLGRRKSLLSRQYKPRADDGVGEVEEKIVPVRRNRSIYSGNGPQLTISDLQKLEVLAEEASQSDDPTKLRSLIRRSMSMNAQPSFIDQIDDVPADEADAPIIVPRQRLQRAARTKIRKPGLPGDGGGHRFASTRRGQRAQTADPNMKLSQDASSVSDHGDEPYSRPGAPMHDYPEDELAQPATTHIEVTIPTFVDDSAFDGTDQRRSSHSGETGEDEDYVFAPSPPTSSSIHTPHTKVIPPERGTPPPLLVPQANLAHIELPPSAPNSPYTPQQQQHQQQQQQLSLQHPQPKRHLDVPGQSGRSASPTSGISPPSSPDPSYRSPSTSPSEHPTRPPLTSSASSSQISTRGQKEKPKEKEKKGGLFGWGAKEKTKDSAANGAKKVNEKEKEKEKEKESGGGFFSFFGKGKKSDDHSGSIGSGAGRETAAALLGKPASKSYMGSPQGASAAQLLGFGAGGLGAGVGAPGQYARYPIHVERAVYRLSHIKLANPRRPLYEQVLISNLMFWYLGIINKPPVPANIQNNNNNPAANTEKAQPDQNKEEEARQKEEKERLEREREEQRAREAQEQREKERLERERAEKERQAALAAERDKGRRGSLTKESRGGSAVRKAETPVRGPGYDVQSRMMEQEGYGPSSGMPRGGSGPPGPAPSGSHQAPAFHLPHRAQNSAGGTPPRPPRAEPPPIHVTPQQPYFYQQDMNQVAYQPMNPYALPPGAKPPAPVENSWAFSHSDGRRSPVSPVSPNSSTGSGYQRASSEMRHSPSSSRDMGGLGRSLSANAVPTNDRSSVRSGGAAPPPLMPSSAGPSSTSFSQRQSNKGHGGSYSVGEVPPMNGKDGNKVLRKKSAGNVNTGSLDSSSKRRKSMDSKPAAEDEDFGVSVWRSYQAQQELQQLQNPQQSAHEQVPRSAPPIPSKGKSSRGYR